MDFNTAGMNPEQIAKAVQHRKKVYEVIEALTDVVEIDHLHGSLHYLHTISWDEMVDERYLAQVCGLPICGEKRPPPRQQKFRIDRKSKAIYEACSERDKFCSERCFQSSLHVRAQLFDEPFWMCGEASYRMEKKFDVTKLTEKDVPMESKPVEEKENDSEKIPTPKKPRKAEKGVNLPTRKSKKEEDEILERLRKKYANGKPSTMKKAILIDPMPMDPETVRKCQNAEKINSTDDLLTSQFMNLEITKKQPKSTVDNEEMKLVKETLASWVSTGTRKMVVEGARPAAGEMETIFMNYLAGKESKTGAAVELPDTDKFDISERRTAILVKMLRPMFLELETKISVSRTRRDLLMRLISSFSLNASNIAGFSKAELRLMSISLLRILSRIDLELGDEVFPKGNISPALRHYGQEVGLIDTNLDDFLKFTDGLISEESVA